MLLHHEEELINGSVNPDRCGIGITINQAVDDLLRELAVLLPPAIFGHLTAKIIGPCSEMFLLKGVHPTQRFS